MKTPKKIKSVKTPKKILIDRLIAKSSLDFRCCGHGGKPKK